MSTAIHAEASKPQKKMQECNRCKSAGFPNQAITFEKIGEDSHTGKIIWKLLDGNGREHIHRGTQNTQSRRKRIADIATVSDVDEAKKLLRLGWEYKTSFPATLANVPHYVLVKRE